MRYNTKSLRYQIVCLTISFLCLSTAYSLDDSDVTEMSLQLQNNDVDIKFPGSVAETKMSRIQLIWWQPLVGSIEGGLNLSYVELSQKTSATVTAYDTSGYEIGIGFRGLILDTEILNLGLQFSLDYLSAQGDTNLEQDVDITWLKYSSSLDFEFIPLSPVTILTGVSYSKIDGEHELLDTPNSVVEFNEDDAIGYYIGLSIKSGNSGKIAVTVNNGHREGIYLVFSNRF